MLKQKFRKLDIWVKSMDLIESIYKITKGFPANEIYGLTSQLQRSALSIALNIAEGSGSGSDNEFKRFLNISLRSAYEVICAIEVARRLKYLESQAAEKLLKEADDISAMIYAFIQRLKADSGGLKA